MLAIALLAVAILWLLAFRHTGAGASSGTYAVPTPSINTTHQPHAVFFGDSYSEYPKPQGYQYIVGAAMGWAVDTNATGGSGYVTRGFARESDPRPLADRVSLVTAMHPDIVVVAAGLNDNGRPGAAGDREFRAAVRIYDEIRAALPHVRIVVVGPWDPPHADHAAVRVIRDQLARAAAARKLPFIDPATWLPARYIGPDGTHPNEAGQARIGRLLTAALKRIGFRVGLVG